VFLLAVNAFGASPGHKLIIVIIAATTVCIVSRLVVPGGDDHHDVVTLPHIPVRTVLDYGARSDAISDDGEAVQRALAEGPGTVVVPAGR
jgi:hypothetical protein